LTIFAAGGVLAARFVYYYFQYEAGKHLGSMIMSAVLLIIGSLVLVIGLLADVISGNRKLLEDLVYRVRSLELPEPSRDQQPRPLSHTAERPDRWEH
jgi:hypothetical protein